MKTSHDFATLETIAQLICMVSGSDWEAKGTKRNHWRNRAAKVMDKQSNKGFLQFMQTYIRVMM